MKIFYKKANKVISISKELGSDLKKLTNSNIQTIYNAAFDKEIYKKSKEKNNFKKNCKIILNVARFEKQKNHLMLLKAFKTTVKKINCKLILVGYGSEERNIKKFIKFNNLSKKVFIYKNSKNSYKFYKIADLFVLTSLYEGFGNVLVEAGMFKVPIISTNCKSGPKEILKNGRCGDLIKVNDYKSLSKCMIKNLKKKNTSKINAMYNSLNRFKIKTHISKYEKIFNEI